MEFSEIFEGGVRDGYRDGELLSASGRESEIDKYIEMNDGYAAECIDRGKHEMSVYSSGKAHGLSEYQDEKRKER